MGPSTRQLQDDDAQNPAFLWVAGGREAWHTVPPAAAGRTGADAPRACAGCHGELDTAMRGVAARYPVFDAVLGRALGLGQRINQCRTTRQGLPAWPAEHDDLLGLEAAIARASRGLPITPPDDPALEAVRTRGRQLYFTRLGQLNLSCAHCHDERAGLRLGGATIPQAHPTGYPLYRLEWQSIGSLQRRLRGCLNGVRAEPFGPDAAEWVALEAYLKQRAAGMAMDAPAVRP